MRLGFGADDKIKIERSMLKRNEGSAGLLVTTSKTDERSFKTPCATAMISRSGSRSRISCRQRERRDFGRDAAFDNAADINQPARQAACWNGVSKPRPAK